MNDIQLIIINSILESKIIRDIDYKQIIKNVNLDFKYDSTNIIVYDNLECTNTIKDMLESDKICDNKSGIRIISEICCNEEVRNNIYKLNLILDLLKLIMKNRDNWLSIYGIAIMLYLSEIDTSILKKYLNNNKLKNIDISLIFYTIISENTGSMLELIYSLDDSLFLRVKRYLANKINDKLKYDLL